MIIASTLNGITDTANDIVLLVFLALFSVISVIVGVWTIAANANKPEKLMVGKLSTLGLVWIIIGAGFIIRIAFSLLTVGYLGTNSINPMTNQDGLIGMYGYLWDTLRIGFPDASQYPVHTYIQLFFAKALDIFGGFDRSGNIVMRLLFRLPYMLCDGAAAFVLYKIAKKYANSMTGVAVAALYSLCPIFFFASGIWGSATSMVSLLVLLSLYFMTQKKYWQLTLTYGLALLTAPEAVFFLPIFAVFYIYNLVKAVGQYRSNADSKNLGIKQLFLDKERGLIIRIPVYIVGSLLVMYLVSMPMLKHIGYNFFTWFAQIYVHPFTKITTFSNNAFSIYSLFSRNNALLTPSTPVWLISLGFLLITVALVCVLYISKKNRANLTLIAAYSVTTLGIFGMGFGELTLLPVLPALLLAFVLIKDKRILQIFAALAVIMVINASAVMASAGYFGSTEVNMFALSTGTTLLSKTTFGMAMNITSAVLAMLTLVYFTFVVLDVCMTGRRLPLESKNNSFGEAMKAWFAKGIKK